MSTYMTKIFGPDAMLEPGAGKPETYLENNTTISFTSREIRELAAEYDQKLNDGNKGQFIRNLNRLVDDNVNFTTQIRRAMASDFLEVPDLWHVWVAKGIDGEVDEVTQKLTTRNDRLANYNAQAKTTTQRIFSARPALTGQSTFSARPALTGQSTFSARPALAGQSIFSPRPVHAGQSGTPSEGQARTAQTTEKSAVGFGSTVLEPLKAVTGLFKRRPAPPPPPPRAEGEGEEMLPEGTDPRKAVEECLAKISSETLPPPNMDLPPPGADTRPPAVILAKIQTLQEKATELSEEAIQAEKPIKEMFKEVVLRHRQTLNEKRLEMVANMQAFHASIEMEHPWAPVFEQQNGDMVRLINEMSAELLTTFDEAYLRTSNGLFALEEAVNEVAKEVLPPGSVKEGLKQSTPPEAFMRGGAPEPEGEKAPGPGEPTGPKTGTSKNTGLTAQTIWNAMRIRLGSGRYSRATTEHGLARALKRAAAAAAGTGKGPQKKPKSTPKSAETARPEGAGPDPTTRPEGAGPAPTTRPDPTTRPEGAGPNPTTTPGGAGSALAMLGDL